jgi:arylformamidase
VPACETLAGVDHFSILRELADPGARLHGLARQLLGLA